MSDNFEADARELGWAPKDQFRGDPEKWVDAETFVKRGERMVPLLKATNTKLSGEISSVRAQNQTLQAELESMRQSMTDLVTFQAGEVKRQVAEKMATLRGQKTAAIKAGEHDLAAEIDEQIDELRDNPPKAPSGPKKAEPAAPGVKVEPWAQAFADENDWLGKDKRRTALFAAEAEILHAAGGLSGKALLDQAKENMEATLNPKGSEPSRSKVDSGSGGRSGGGGEPRAKGFSDLPSDAKAACRDQERKMVGVGKPFKDSAAWQKHFTEVYLADEE